MELVVAVPADTKSEDSQVSYHFGRAPYFYIAIIRDGEIVESKFIENVHARKHEGQHYGLHHNHHRGGHGSHFDLIEIFLRNEVGAVVAVHLGPRLIMDLKGVGIKIYRGVEGSLRDNVELLIRGKLSEF